MKRSNWDGAGNGLSTIGWVFYGISLGAPLGSAAPPLLAAAIFWLLYWWRRIRVNRGAKLTGVGEEIARTFRERDYYRDQNLILCRLLEVVRKQRETEVATAPELVAMLRNLTRQP